MRAAGFDTSSVTHLFIEMLEEANNKQPDYETIKNNAVFITIQQKEAFKDLLELKEEEIVGFEKATYANTTLLWGLYTHAQIEVANNEYAEAIQTINALHSALEELRVEQSKFVTKLVQQKNEISEWFWNNTSTIVLFIFIISFFILLMKKDKIGVFILKRKIEHLSIEQEVVEKLIKRVEREYHEQKTPQSMYQMEVTMYKERLGEIDERLSLARLELEHRQRPWLRMRMKKRVIHEIGQLEKKEIQNKKPKKKSRKKLGSQSKGNKEDLKTLKTEQNRPIQKAEETFQRPHFLTEQNKKQERQNKDHLQETGDVALLFAFLESLG